MIAGRAAGEQVSKRAVPERPRSCEQEKRYRSDGKDESNNQQLC
jgi:hypothetical protein